MSYNRASGILPMDVLELVQQYIDGEFLYIPRKSSEKKKWGSKTSIRQELAHRDRQIYQDYQAGYNSESLSQKYYLSVKSVQRIIRQEHRKAV
jgi:Mor family transcriptional regulator